MCCGRDIIREFGQVRRTANQLELGLFGELITERQQVNRTVALVEAHHRIKDQDVALIIKIIRAKLVADVRQRFFVNQNSAE